MANYTMPLTAHLGELRKRLIVSVIALTVTFCIAFNYSRGDLQAYHVSPQIQPGFFRKKIIFSFCASG